MKSFKIEKKYIVWDIVITVLAVVILLCVIYMGTNMNTAGFIALLVASIVMLCYHFYTLIKCCRFDKHTQVTISDNNVCYTNQFITIEFGIDDISEYWHCTSSIIGHSYSTFKLKNQKFIFITDLIDTKDIYRSCKDRKIEIHHGTDVFLIGLASRNIKK